jgi:hypothetical protein
MCTEIQGHGEPKMHTGHTSDAHTTHWYVKALGGNVFFLAAYNHRYTVGEK